MGSRQRVGSSKPCAAIAVLNVVKIATWNVNSLRVRLPQLSDWLKQQTPDIVCLQETRIIDDDFPATACRDLHYHVIFNGQKTYNGVAILSRMEPANVEKDMPGFDDAQKRVIAASYGDVRVINVYVPNGGAVGSDKYFYKLDWLKQFADYVREQLHSYPKLIVAGDFNVAPEDRDVYDPTAWAGAVLASEPEREGFRRLLSLGLGDAFRKLEAGPGHYSWWDYRIGAFRRNLGLRIDHILASPSLLEACDACYIDSAPRGLDRPSDHAPVIAEFKLEAVASLPC